MVKINGKTFYDKPTSCGQCPFFFLGSSDICPSVIGVCNMFNENHKFYINPPKRCQKLFNKAFRMPDGSELIIVYNQ